MLKEVTAMLAMAFVASSCGASKKSSPLGSSIDEDSVISSWFDDISAEMKSDPQFFSKVHDTSSASFTGYAQFIQEDGKGFTFDAKAAKGFQSLDKNYKSLASFLKEQDIDTGAITRTDVRTALFVAKHGEAPASISNLKGAAIAMKVALFLRHRDAAPASGLALAGGGGAKPATSSSSSRPSESVGTSSSSAGAGAGAGAGGTPTVPQTPSAAIQPTTTSSTASSGGASGSTATGGTAAGGSGASRIGTAADGLSAAGSLMAGGAGAATAASTTNKNDADLTAQKNNAHNNRYCGTFISGPHKNQNAYLPESQVLANKDIKCGADTQRGATSAPLANSEANSLVDIPNDANNPTRDADGNPT